MITSTRSSYLNFCPLYSAKKIDPNTPTPLETIEFGKEGKGWGRRLSNSWKDLWRGTAERAKGFGGRGKVRPDKVRDGRDRGK
jgi:hypothetical protein